MLLMIQLQMMMNRLEHTDCLRNHGIDDEQAGLCYSVQLGSNSYFFYKSMDEG